MNGLEEHRGGAAAGGKDRRENGSALLAVLLLTSIGLLGVHLLTRHALLVKGLSVRNYHRRVALDLAESGVEFAATRLSSGVGLPSEALVLFEERGMKGVFFIEANDEGGAEGETVVTSSGKLLDSKGAVLARKQVKCLLRRAESGRFVVKSWEENSE